MSVRTNALVFSANPDSNDGFYCPIPVVSYETEERLEHMMADLKRSHDSLINNTNQRAKLTLDGPTYTKLAAALESLYFEVLFIQQVATRKMRTRTRTNCYPQPGERNINVILVQTRILHSATQYLENLSNLRSLAWATVPEDQKERVSSFWTPENYRDPNWSLRTV